MGFTHFFIERPIFAGVLSFAIFLGGLIAAFVLPVSEYPEVSPPTVVVSAQYPGANPQVVADTVAAPLEQEIVGVEDMIYMSSLAQQDGSLQISVVFALGADIDRAQVLVQNRVSQALPRLPAEVRALGVTTRKTSPDLTLVVHVYSPDGRYDGLYLRNYALIQIRDELARLPGAGDVRLFGAGDYAMRVWLDPQKLAARNLTTGDVIAAVREQNLQVAAGSVGAAPTGDSAFQLAINTRGRLSSEQEFGEIIVKTGASGELTRLADVARLELGAGEYSLRSLLDNSAAVAMPVFLQPGANALELADAVQAKMRELEQSFPEGVDYQVVYDTTVFVRESIRAVIDTLLEAVVLVVLVVLLFLQRWRAALIPIIAVPVSIVGTLAVLQMFGFSLNTLTLFALVLAVGIVVDDAIVVVENVERSIAEGRSPRQAAHRSMEEVGGAIVAISLVLCAVFIPPALAGGFSGQFYRQFALTIAFAALISAFNSLTLSPALCAVLLQPHGAAPDRLQRGIDRTLGWLFRPFNRGFLAAGNAYQQGVRRLLRVAGVGLAVYAGLVVLAGVSFVNAPTSLVPNQDKGYLVTMVTLPPSASIERTEDTLRRIAGIGLTEPGVRHAVQFPGLSINGFTRSSSEGIVFFPLQPFDQRGTGERGSDLAARLNQRLAEVSEAKILTVLPPPVRGFGPAGGFKLQVEDRADRGPVALFDATQALMARARQTPGLENLFSNYEINAPQLHANIDRDQAKRLGVPLENVFQTLQAYLGSYYVNDFNRFGRTFRVIVQADQDFRDRPRDVLLLKTRNLDGDMVPLGSVMTLEDSFGPTTVQRYNGYPSADINGMPAPGHSSGQALSILAGLADEMLPSGMTFEWTELTYQQVEAGSALGVIFPLCVLLVFLVLAAQYESLSLPLAVILIVPMCLLSAVAGILLRGLDVNIFTQIGLFVLVGLAAKNAILIVEFARDAQSRGLNAAGAALEACRLRLRPIVMTSVAFILGVLPLAMASGAGAEIANAMGTAVFAGMIGVTGFGLFFTPLFYVVLRRSADRKAQPDAPQNPEEAPLRSAV